MDYFPAFHDLRGRAVLIVGGGEIAARKYALLQRAGARVELVAPALCAELAAARARGEFVHSASAYAGRELSAYTLIVAATDSREVNARVAADAGCANRPVNVVDTPALCSFIVPAIVDRSPVQVAISTGGAAPVLARKLRSQIEALLPAGLGRFAALSARFRERVKRRFPGLNARRRFWERLIDSPLVERLMQVEESAAEALFEAELRAPAPEGRGEVYLVGAGPGDPELLTLKGLRLLQQADVVVYDRLVSAEVLELARRDAERIYVGKAKAAHTLPQDEINELLLRLARAGQRVCRLKGGDPFVFGRGGEELAVLVAAGVPCQIAPGITAALGCAASARIPLTHREHAQSLVYVAGQGKDGDVAANWPLLAQPAQTVVFYMGLSSLPRLTRELLAHGRAPETPAALIENGTLASERVIAGTLQSLPQLALAVQPNGPVLVVVGEVVALRESLQPCTQAAAALAAVA